VGNYTWVLARAHDSENDKAFNNFIKQEICAILYEDNIDAVRIVSREFLCNHGCGFMKALIMSPDLNMEKITAWMLGWTFDTANFKILFTWTKGNRRAACVEAIRSAREVIAAHSTTLCACRFIAICFT